MQKKYTEICSIEPTKFHDSSVRKTQYQTLTSSKLSIIDLFLVNTFIAITVSAITSIGLLGVHLLLIVCLLVNVHHIRRFADQPTRFRFWNQFIWVILLPLACVFGDPFVFGQFEFGRVVYLTNYGIACYFFVGWQMLVMAVSWYVKEAQSFINEFIAGTMFGGSFFAFAVGICLLPLTLLGTLAMGLGVPGVIPWFTGMVLLNSSKMHCQRLGNKHSGFYCMWVIGAVLPIVFSVFIFLFANSFADTVGIKLNTMDDSEPRWIIIE